MSTETSMTIMIEDRNIGDSITSFPALYQLAEQKPLSLWFDSRQVAGLWAGPSVTMLSDPEDEGLRLDIVVPNKFFIRSGFHMIQAWYWNLGMPVPSSWPIIPLAGAVAADNRIDVIISPYSLSGRLLEHPWKIWSYERWNVVIDSLLAAGLSVAVCGVFGDDCDELFWGDRPVRVLDRLPLVELAGYLRAAQCVATVDNGIGHLTHLLGLPHAQLIPAHPRTCPPSWIKNHHENATSLFEPFDILQPERVLEVIFAVLSRFNSAANLGSNPGVPAANGDAPRRWIGLGREKYPRDVVGKLTVPKGDRSLRQLLDWDEDWYVRRYPDLSAARERGVLGDPLLHYLWAGRHEGRFPSARAEEEAKRAEDRGIALDDAHINLGGFSVPFNWPVKGEPAKTFPYKLTCGFFESFMSGAVILDVGYRGGAGDAVPILPHAIGVDIDYPGYDGVRLPFDDGSVDTVFASHVLEHILDSHTVIRDWFRTVRPGGFIVCVVPHQFLYEKKSELPSHWNGDHKRFYTPGSLLREFEESLPPNSYRVRHLTDNDLGYHYEIGPEQHAVGCFEIELVIEKINPPAWDLR